MTEYKSLSRFPDWAMARFLVIGSIGFIADASILVALILSGTDAYVARMISFGIAVLVTWWGNRNWTFRDRADQPKRKELSAYLLVQLCGASINYAVYAFGLYLLGTSSLQAFIALACGSIAAMFFNFFGARYAVFRPTLR